ncbi:unnamed protein product [Effrenium voratum]|nr:unnamed protein product [Effrenium voratum]CAJ1414519.1 unnamed protein product [Effrenium voratum]|eukprot:CAMPEP_0181435204 /NCGR_PEP_ID=MMETSP1110-20121109/20212_1 /TAXON_ID=174948 /ORGANISM="Symbiodinium sp., Strain CCMP421" /LENGTH=237 /DNA_ID=CAMNT_0023558731 /DNA_START=141 /DNA_END=854 /DNA_ORIENTATION=+
MPILRAVILGACVAGNFAVPSQLTDETGTGGSIQATVPIAFEQHSVRMQSSLVSTEMGNALDRGVTAELNNITSSASQDGQFQTNQSFAENNSKAFQQHAQSKWASKTSSPPSETCPMCCRGMLKESCPSQQSQASDPCADQSVCTGFHRCFGAKRGFVQCQYKPGSEVRCKTGPNCLPECTGTQLGKEGDDCALQPAAECEGFVRRGGQATQCKVKKGGNPSGADICDNVYLCGVR